MIEGNGRDLFYGNLPAFSCKWRGKW